MGRRFVFLAKFLPPFSRRSPDLLSTRHYVIVVAFARRNGERERHGKARRTAVSSRSPAAAKVRSGRLRVAEMFAPHEALERRLGCPTLHLKAEVGLPKRIGLPFAACCASRSWRTRDLPVLARGVSVHARGLRPRVIPDRHRHYRPQDIAFCILVLHRRSRVCQFSRLNTPPAHAPVERFQASSRTTTHDSGSA